MSKLRDSARGQLCQLRFPGCNGDPETTVLAHLRLGGIAGVGLKPPDVCAVFACSDCHSLLDGRTPIRSAMDPAEFWKCTLKGHLRTLKFWTENGYL